MGRVSNLRVVESLGSTVRLGWTGVAGATQYRIIILNEEGDFYSLFYYYYNFYFTNMDKNMIVNILLTTVCFISFQWEQRKSGLFLETRQPLTSET